MAIEGRELAIAAGALLAGGAVVYVVSRGGVGAPSPELAIATTGPSEETSRELIRAGVDVRQIEASERVDLAGIFASGLVDLTRIESQERISLSDIEAQRQLGFEQARTSRDIATIIGDVEKFRAKTLLKMERVRADTAQQKNLFDLLQGGLTAILGALF